MMNGGIEIYKVWAPNGARWTEWAKPVLFANMSGGGYGRQDIPALDWISRMDESTAIIVDLPGKAGVLEGLALARLGYRPVPLYNGVCGPFGSKMAVKVDDLVDALYHGAAELSKISFMPDAPPAFLLDADRMREPGKRPGAFDNRWCVFPQDMPSASYLISKGIRKVIVRTKRRQEDLAHILYAYQTGGIETFSSIGSNQKRVTVVKPSSFKNMFYRFRVIAGLKRNAAGGFGGHIPDFSESGGIHYRYG